MFFLLFTVICNAQTIKEGWNSFDGYIFENDITVNIYRDSIGNLTGDYCYKKEETRIPLKGKLNGNAIILDEFTDNKITAKFSGKIEEEKNIITGKCSSTTHSDKVFFLRLSSQTSGSLDNKYLAFFRDKDVELFFKNAKKAILTDDKIWLSENSKYPIVATISNKKVKVKTAKDFISKYSKIITTKYKNDIKNSCICDIFSNSDGAMIANGAIWINELDDHHLKITAINN